ncbi:MAG: cyclodeaminase/cyclohydrolase family protein [Desulfobulbaceae bacterium]|nr:cyclodeaminase/cyclohydrolase family protein [Desulfobulbaceae bacterium]
MSDAMTIRDFLKETASKAPVPGGGSVSALAGALAAALTEMVANLTIGRKGHEHSLAEMENILRQASLLREKLTQAVSLDAEAFQQVMTAQRLPRTTDEEKKSRAHAMQAALQHAARVPLEVARDGLNIIAMAQTVVEHGNPNAITDGAVAAMMARTAALGALYNVEINLCSIKDPAFVSDVAAQVKKIRSRAFEEEKTLLKRVDLAIKG